MRPYKLKISPESWKWVDLDHVLEISQPLFTDEPYLGYLSICYKLAFIDGCSTIELQYHTFGGIANHRTFACQSEAIAVYDDFVKAWKSTAENNLIPLTSTTYSDNPT